MDAGIVRLLGLDQSQTATGWSIGGLDDAPPKSGVFRSAPWGTNEGRGLLRFSRFLHETFEQYQITHCVYEEPYIPKGKVVDIHAIKIMCFLEAQINFQCEMDGVKVKMVSIDQWRSRFLGTTKAAPGLKGPDARKDLKDKAIVACARHGWMITDDNEAEARGVMAFGLGDLSPEYARRMDPHARRAELQQDIKAFRGES